MFIKLSINNSTRKIKVADDVALAVVKAEIVKMFGDKVKDMTLCYKDAESETITVTSEEDWEVCVEEFKEKNQGKPTLSVSLHLLQSEEFESVNDSKLEKIDAAVAQEESEIKEEPKEAAVFEELTDDKVVEEKKEEEVSEEDDEESESENSQVGDQIIETEIKVPINENTKVEDLRKIAESYSQHLSSMLGYPVDVLEARIEPSHNVEESFAEESVSSTLTTEQRTEIEDIIEQKMSKMLDMKKEKKAPTTEITHWNITCDNCKKGIKNMARFKSLVKHDYDLCEECEKTGVHTGPMVKYSAPSKYSPWQLNKQFRDFNEFFKHETSETQSRRESTEDFRMPHRHHQHSGPSHHGQFRHMRPGHPCRGPFGGRNPQEFFKTMGETMKPFSDIFSQVLPGVFGHFAAQTAETKPQTEAKTEVTETKRCRSKCDKKAKKDTKKCSKKESKKEAKKEEKVVEKSIFEEKEEKMDANTLAKKVTEEVPEFNLDVDILESIITQNGFTSVDQVVNYLL